ncbi:MAG: helix-turn-helix domain-containing protein [Candidatus Fimenecus sp.]
MQADANRIQIAPTSAYDAAFAQRESGIAHTPYQAENAFFACIQQGDVHLLQEKMEQYFQNGVVVGKLSDDPLRQMQYWGVSSVTLAVRAAIQGGLDEMTAYNLSDSYIRSIDKMQSPDEILIFLIEKAGELTALVSKVRGQLRYSPYVRRCMACVERRLHEKITVSLLAEEIGITADYLSAVFKKETGEPLSRYILNRKLEEAKRLLENGCDSGFVAYTLAFCSESYFIACFKRAFGVTPRGYIAAQAYKK